MELSGSGGVVEQTGVGSRPSPASIEEILLQTSNLDIFSYVYSSLNEATDRDSLHQWARPKGRPCHLSVRQR
jgi:hypothetical protein